MFRKSRIAVNRNILYLCAFDKKVESHSRDHAEHQAPESDTDSRPNQRVHFLRTEQKPNECCYVGTDQNRSGKRQHGQSIFVHDLFRALLSFGLGLALFACPIVHPFLDLPETDDQQEDRGDITRE